MDSADTLSTILHRIGLRPEPFDIANPYDNDMRGDDADMVSDKYYSTAHTIQGYTVSLSNTRAQIALHLPGTLSASDLAILDGASVQGGTVFPNDRILTSHFVRLSMDFQSDGALARPTEMLRILCQIAYQCCVCIHPDFVFWSAAQIWSEATQFSESVEEMFTSGVPPVAQLVNFVPPHAVKHVLSGDVQMQENVTSNLSDNSRISRGLALFCGQEILADVPETMSVAELTRRMSRLAADMIVNGPILQQRSFAGIEPGERIHLIPSQFGNTDVGLVRMMIV